MRVYPLHNSDGLVLVVTVSRWAPSQRWNISDGQFPVSVIKRKPVQRINPGWPNIVKAWLVTTKEWPQLMDHLWGNEYFEQWDCCSEAQGLQMVIERPEGRRRDYILCHFWMAQFKFSSGLKLCTFTKRWRPQFTNGKMLYQFHV